MRDVRPFSSSHGTAPRSSAESAVVTDAVLSFSFPPLLEPVPVSLVAAVSLARSSLSAMGQYVPRATIDTATLLLQTMTSFSYITRAANRDAIVTLVPSRPAYCRIQWLSSPTVARKRRTQLA